MTWNSLQPACHTFYSPGLVQSIRVKCNGSHPEGIQEILIQLLISSIPRSLPAVTWAFPSKVLVIDKGKAHCRLQVINE